MRVGKQPSIKDLLEGREKLKKDDVVASSKNGKPTKQIESVIDGESSEYGYFIVVLFNDNTYVHVPKASINDMKENVGEDYSSGNYGLVMECSKSKNNRDYYTCYIELM